MGRVLKIVIGVVAVLVAAFLVVFFLAKQKIIFINDFLIDEASSTIGVDLSAYQANVDMERLHEQGVAFAYIKATEGSSHQDEMFRANWDNAQKAGLPAGAYHFFSYDSPGSTQAENFIAAVGESLAGRLVPVVDVEYYGDKEDNPPAKEDVVRELVAFLDAVEARYGVRPMIYTRSDLYDKYLEGFSGEYKMWISSLYTPLGWNYKGDWYLWQYSDHGRLDGYSGGVEFIDLNVLNSEKSLDELVVG